MQNEIRSVKSRFPQLSHKDVAKVADYGWEFAETNPKNRHEDLERLREERHYNEDMMVKEIEAEHLWYPTKEELQARQRSFSEYKAAEQARELESERLWYPTKEELRDRQRSFSEYKAAEQARDLELERLWYPTEEELRDRQRAFHEYEAATERAREHLLYPSRQTGGPRRL